MHVASHDTLDEQTLVLTGVVVQVILCIEAVDLSRRDIISVNDLSVHNAVLQ